MEAWGQGQEGGITKSHKETFGGDGYVPYTDSSDDFAHMPKLAQLYTLNTAAYWYQLYLSEAVKNPISLSCTLNGSFTYMILII